MALLTSMAICVLAQVRRWAM